MHSIWMLCAPPIVSSHAGQRRLMTKGIKMGSWVAVSLASYEGFVAGTCGTQLNVEEAFTLLTLEVSSANQARD